MEEVTDIRLVFFSGVLIAGMGAEWFWPRRPRVQRRSQRWPLNFSLTAFNSILAHITIGGLPVALAVAAQKDGYGLLPWLGLGGVWAIFISYLALDALIYFQHRLFHWHPLLFRLHAVHHADLDLDVTSGFRFHPLEIFLSLIIKSVVIFAMGAHPMGVLVFEVLLNAGSLFNHCNINIRGRVDHFLRIFIVTPDMHRIHHSQTPAETDSNFSFTISIWDRLGGTYTPHPKKTQQDIEIGLSQYKDPIYMSLKGLFFLPFHKVTSTGESEDNDVG